MKKSILGLLALPLFFASCGDEEVIPTPATTGEITLNLTSLDDLGDDYVYEGWIIVDGNPVTTGTFTVDADRNLSQTTFTVDATQLEAATKFVLSIEPTVDTDPAPSAVKYLAGDFSGDDATVNTGIVGDFSAAAGKFIVAAPTTASMDDDLSGVWFLDNSSGSPVASLELPTLDAGWAYEGWAVIDGQPVSTGTFTAGNAADASSVYNGSDNPAPPFPGEDFIVNAPSGLTFPTELAETPIVISVEPVPDNSAAPFTLKPLIKVTPATPSIGMPYDLDNKNADLPTGTVSRVIR